MSTILCAAWLAAAAAGVVPSHAVILLYHHVDEGTPASTTTSPDLFSAHLDWLAEEGFALVPLGAVVDSLRQGRPLPDRTAVLTFDDGYVSVYTEAFPRLRARGWPFTVFVCPTLVGERPGAYVSWPQLREMAAAGATVASHGLRHEHLQRRREGEDEAAWRTRVRGELLEAEDVLRRELGTAPGLLAYPYGEFDPDLRALVIEQGWAGCGQQSGAAGALSDLASLPRFPLMGEYAELDGFAEKMLSLPLPVVSARPEDPRLPADDPTRRRPLLRLELADDRAAWGRASAFASGQGRAAVRWDAEHRELQVEARAPLPRGRSRYNVTAPSAWPGRWYWYSHTWIVGEEHEN